MDDLKLYVGFNQNFLSNDDSGVIVNFPVPGPRFSDDIAPVEGVQDSILHYLNYSVQLSASRKFPLFTASNIDGTQFKKASRAPSWKKDKRVQDFQWGTELYSAPKSDFDKGHMTKREDVQWGKTPGLAQKAANSTFYYSNAVPQHKDLNQQIWKSLEDYVLHTETRQNSLKVCVFTGPVLSKSDLPFVTTVNGETVLIPIVFWKVIVYPKSDGKLYRVGFMMSQRKLLVENEIVEQVELQGAEDELFMQFEDAETYQVNISLIEKMSGLTMPEAIDSYTDNRTNKLVLEEIDIDPDAESFSVLQTIGFKIPDIVL